MTDSDDGTVVPFRGAMPPPMPHQVDPTEIPIPEHIKKILMRLERYERLTKMGSPLIILQNEGRMAVRSWAEVTAWFGAWMARPDVQHALNYNPDAEPPEPVAQ